MGEFEADKSLERQDKIAWARKGRNAQGVRTIEVGEGELCLPCDDTRKYNFASVSSKTLKAIRQDNPDIEEKFRELRRKNARGEGGGSGKRKHEKVPTEHLVTKRRRQFKESFQDHEFATLEDLCIEKGVECKYPTKAKRRHFVQEILGLDVQEDSDGEEGVLIACGRKKVRVGTADHVDKEKQQRVGDKKAASDLMAQDSRALNNPTKTITQADLDKRFRECKEMEGEKDSSDDGTRRVQPVIISFWLFTIG